MKIVTIPFHETTATVEGNKATVTFQGRHYPYILNIIKDKFPDVTAIKIENMPRVHQGYLDSIQGKISSVAFEKDKPQELDLFDGQLRITGNSATLQCNGARSCQRMIDKISKYDYGIEHLTIYNLDRPININSLKQLKSFSYIDLNSREDTFRNILGLRELTQLTDLEVVCHGKLDLFELQYLQNLKKLRISNGSFSEDSIDPDINTLITHFRELEFLRLNISYFNRIDVANLDRLRSLGAIQSSTYIDDPQPDRKLLTELEKRGITFINSSTNTPLIA